MDNSEKKVLVDVDIKATQALKELAELRIKADELKKAQKELDRTTDEGRQQYEALGQQIKALNTVANERQKTIQSEIKTQNEQKGSLQQLKAELSLMTAQYNKLSEADRNTARGQALSKSIADTTNKLSEAEKALGNFHRQVGNYEVATKGLRTQVRELTEQLVNMKMSNKDTSEEYKVMADQLAMLKDAMADVSEETTKMASDTQKLDTVNNTLTLMTGIFGSYQAIMAGVNDDNKEYLDVMKKLQIAAVALTAATQIQNAIQKQSNFYKLASIIVEKTRIKVGLQNLAVTVASNKAVTTNIITTKLLTAAQWLLNKAMAANPAVLLLMALVALGAGILALMKIFDKSAKAQKNAEKASQAYEKQAERTAVAIDNLNNKEKNATNERENRLRREILDLQKNGATAEQIAAARARGEQDLRDIAIKASKEREIARYKEYQASLANIKAQRAYLATLEDGSKKHREQLKNLNDIIKAHNALSQTILEERQKQEDLNIKSDEEAQKRRDENRKRYQEAAMKALEWQKKLQDEQNRLVEIGMSQEFEEVQKWQAEKFKQQQEYERKKLDMQLKFGQITRAEHEAQNRELIAAQKTFDNKQLSDTQKYYDEQREHIKSLIGRNIDEQIDMAKEKYETARKELAEMPEPVQLIGESDIDFNKRMQEYKEYMLERASMMSELEAKEAKELAEIRKSNIEETLKRQYADDLAKFADNEREKTRITIEQLQVQLEQKKAAGLETYEEEAQLRAEQVKLNNIALTTDLLNNANNERAKYELKRNALNAELELYKDNADKKAEIEAQLAELQKGYIQQRISDFEQYANSVMELMSGINNLSNTLADNEVQKAEEDNEAKRAALEYRLNNGLMSQAKYDEQVAAMDKALDDKKKQIAKQQAMREKSLSVFQIGLNTAMAVMKIWAEVPKMDFGISTGILTAAAIAMGAIQMAAAIATPLPKASKGMLLKGKSHALGGIPIEAEGGEAIINKRSTAMFAPLLSAINQAGGGVPFVAGSFSDGGYVARSVQTKHHGITAKEMSKIMQDLKIYTSMYDFKKAEKNYEQYESIAY